MSHHPPFSAEERLKELKETYYKLFSERETAKKYVLPSDDYQLHYRRLFPVQSTSQRFSQEEKKDIRDELSYKTSLEEPFIYQSLKTPPKLRLRPLLEDLNRKGSMEKRNFMLQRMDELAGTRPAKVMDYVRKQYPSLDCSSSSMVDVGGKFKQTKEDTSANTFFLLGDVHRCIREYLVGNGWIEKFSGPEERSQLIRCLQGLPTSDNRTLGRMLASDPVKFIWVNGFINWSLINNNVIVSRIPSSSYYFSKTALASSIRDLFPFLYQKGFIDVKTPRTYEVRCLEDMKHFTKQYRINACISLMRKFTTSMEPTSRVQLFSEDGTVPLDCLDFAIQRVVEMIRYHQHADLDEWHFSVVSEEDWNVFIFRFYDIVHQEAKFQINHHNINIPKLTYACEKLSIIYEKYFPDTKHDGHRNLWIVKPSNGSCGRGVKVFKRLNEIQQYCKPTNSYVIQKYIENPMLIYQTKFDVRQWFLITSVYPLVIWMYNECYLRFCSQQFSLSNVHESVHLCNNSIQYKYKNGIRSPQLPDDNMWADSTFQTYLSDRDSTMAWPGIKNKMQQAIIAACLVSQDKMYHRTNSFHLYGADFMITPDNDVWLIEINTHPSMKYSTSVTTRMCKEVLQDTLKVGLDRRSNPHADTGKFIEIFRQQAHMPTVGVPSSAAGVHARKIRLLNTMNPREQPTKPFLETSKAPSKFGKWLSYTSVASYKKHNKINFKYVVLRHTDMPLDPGDSITQRDIGYAGVLDKANESENADEGNEEASNISNETTEKEKPKVSTAIPKPHNQITLHRKVIAKLKTKDKISTEKENIEDDTEVGSNKNITSVKLQNTSETQNINTQTITDAKQNEALKSNADMEVQRIKNIQNEVIEVRSIPEIVRTKPGNTTKEANTKTQEKIQTSKKAATIEDAKNVPNSSNYVSENKGANSRKPVISENELSLERNKSSRKSEQTVKFKNVNLEKTKTSKRSMTKEKILNKQASKAKEEITSKVIKDNKIFVLADTLKKKSAPGKSSKEGTKISDSIIQCKNGPKPNHRVASSKTNKQSSVQVEKVFFDHSLTDSINVLKISKIEREKHLKTKLGIKGFNEKKIGSDSTSKSQNDFAKETMKQMKIGIPASKGFKAKNGLTQKQNKQQYKQNESKKSPPRDSTKPNLLPRAKRRRNKGLIKENRVRKCQKVSGKDMKDDENIIQPEFILMKSDSDSSFKTAMNVSEDELLSYQDSDISVELKPFGDNISFSAHYPSFKDLIEEERINNNSIKRYTNRNKYCE